METLAGTSLAARLVVTFGAIVLLAVIATAAPAYVLITDELEQQAWNRVQDGSRLTQTLLASERTRLGQGASTLAERPTLIGLLEAEDRTDLTQYLTRFRAGADIDLLQVLDEHLTLVAWSAEDASAGQAQMTTDGWAWSSSPGSHLFMQEATPVEAAGTEYRVVAGTALDDAYAKQLAEATGFKQTFGFEGRRLASSLDGGDLPLDPAVAAAWSAGRPERVEWTASGQPLYGVVAPVGQKVSGTSIVLEVALPVDDLRAAEAQWRLALGLGTVLVTVAATGIGLWISRRLTLPLRQLTEAALNIRQGDLTTPVPLPADPPEILTLARALEESRAHVRESLERLARQKDWSDTLLRSIVEGIVTLDGQGRLTSFSPAAERITGWRADDVLGRRVDDVLRTVDGDPFSEELPNPGGRRSVRVLHRSGRHLTLATTAASVRPPDGEAAQLALVVRDITEEESVQSLRSYFLANISHEFRTPLSAINASVELLLDDLESLTAGELRELLDSIHRSVTGLQTLIDNLLESLSIEAGRFTVRRRTTDLPQVLDEAARVMRPLLDRRRQELRCEIPSELPPLWIDPMRITQVLVNLLSNAGKYSPVGEAIVVRVEAPAAGRVRVSVADRGEGIPPAERENLFRRFVRLGVSDAPQYGIGLGLSVVKAIVEEHGGQVGVDERPGGGSIFWFTLPQNQGHA
jgi:two-component system phosphate regulon sensor histidine kinase PhoR